MSKQLHEIFETIAKASTPFMAEQKPIAIPKHLPKLEDAVNIFCEFFLTPVPMLNGMTLKSMFYHAEINRAWCVGSRAWYPAVMGKPCPSNKDIDLVFADKGAALEFVGTVYSKLDNEALYSLSENTKGGMKLSCAMTGQSLIDAWDLDDDQTIAEHIMGFRWDHERVAILIGACPGEIGAITRLVKPDKYGNKVARRSDKQMLEAQNRPPQDYGS